MPGGRGRRAPVSAPERPCQPCRCLSAELVPRRLMPPHSSGIGGVAAGYSANCSYSACSYTLLAIRAGYKHFYRFSGPYIDLWRPGRPDPRSAGIENWPGPGLAGSTLGWAGEAPTTWTRNRRPDSPESRPGAPSGRLARHLRIRQGCGGAPGTFAPPPYPSGPALPSAGIGPRPGTADPPRQSTPGRRRTPPGRLGYASHDRGGQGWRRREARGRRGGSDLDVSRGGGAPTRNRRRVRAIDFFGK